LVSPERVKNGVWFFFKKFGSKRINGQDDLLRPEKVTAKNGQFSDESVRITV
jgi:hypothetical protein